jgi:hypothetical protein
VTITQTGTLAALAGLTRHIAKEVVMSDMRDPLYPRDPVGTPVEPTVTSGRNSASWGWILGGVAAVIVVLALLFSFSGGDQTASNTGSSPVITGQSNAPAAPAPAPAGENTGSR